MVLVFILFWLAIGWGLYDNEIYPKEAAIYTAIWLVLLGLFLFVPKAVIPSVIGMVLVDIALVAKVFGLNTRSN